MGSAPSHPFYAALKIYVRNSKDIDKAVEKQRKDKVGFLGSLNVLVLFWSSLISLFLH